MKNAILCIALVGLAFGMHAQQFSDKIFSYDFSKVESGKDLVATFGEPKELRVDGDSEKWIFENGDERLYVSVKDNQVADFRFSQQNNGQTLREKLLAAEAMDFRGQHIQEVTKDLGPPTEISVRPEGEQWTFRSDSQMLNLYLDGETRTVKDLRLSTRN